jgi:hypothetical protein
MSAPSIVQPVFLEPIFRRAMVVWWGLFWRAGLLSLGAGFVVGFIEGVIGAVIGVPSPTIRMVTMFSGALASIPAGIYAVQMVLRKNYREFSIQLVASSPLPTR